MEDFVRQKKKHAYTVCSINTSTNSTAFCLSLDPIASQALTVRFVSLYILIRTLYSSGSDATTKMTFCSILLLWSKVWSHWRNKTLYVDWTISCKKKKKIIMSCSATSKVEYLSWRRAGGRVLDSCTQVANLSGLRPPTVTSQMKSLPTFTKNTTTIIPSS